MSYTSATVEGFVVQDPILRQTKTGKNVCVFTLAIKHYNPDPNEDSRVSFLDIDTWEGLADSCFKKICKGKRVMVIGTLKQDRWEGTDGKTQSKIKLNANRLRFLDNYDNQEDRIIKEEKFTSSI